MPKNVIKYFFVPVLLGVLIITGFFVFSSYTESANAKSYVTGGTIINKRMLTKGGFTSPIENVYRIYVIGEYLLNGVTKTGKVYYEVSEATYNAYNIGDYFSLSGASSGSSAASSGGLQTCKNCGKDLPGAVKECPKCGTKVGDRS